MSKFRYGRLTAVASSALLALMLLGPASVSAATPGWKFYITPLSPALVKVGSNAAWAVTIANEGTSNISALYLSTDLDPKTTASYPTYIGSVTYSGFTGPANPCNKAGTGPLYCSFGSLPAGTSVSIDVIAFPVVNASSTCTDPSTQVSYSCYAFNFTAFGNGNTPSDKGGNSHGDTLLGPVSVGATTSGDYGGGFSLDDSAVSNAGLSRTNKQSETLSPPVGSSLIQVTIQDALVCGSADTWCAGGFGDVMRLNVNKGSAYPAGFKVVINIDGKLVPSGATVDSIDLVHVLDDGITSYTITQRCSSTTLPTVQGTTPITMAQRTALECITVTKNGPNFQIVAWLLSNGQIRLY